MLSIASTVRRDLALLNRQDGLAASRRGTDRVRTRDPSLKPSLYEAFEQKHAAARLNAISSASGIKVLLDTGPTVGMS